MNRFLSSVALLFGKKISKKDKVVMEYMTHLMGKKPSNLSLYLLAFKHISLSKEKEDEVRHSNERLEYLGDAILGAIVADLLFKKYPFKDEGFMTEARSRLVNGDSLGQLAKKIGLNQLIEYNSKGKQLFGHKSMSGDALEAMVGAVYLDHGFKFCKKFVVEKLFSFLDVEELANQDFNYKSKVINWGQSHFKMVRFDILEEKDYKHYKEFTAQVSVNQEPVAIGVGLSKKKAEQEAARKTCEILAL